MMEKCSPGEDTPLYGWYDTMGNKYITVIDTSNNNKTVRMEMIKDYGSCTKLCQENGKNNADAKPADDLANTRLRSFLKS